MKKILKAHWTGFNACKKWKGNLIEAKQFYKLKRINLNQNFYDGWDLFHRTAMTMELPEEK
jgi:hypothetical protein